jgi:hypothetical protein
MEMFVEYDLQNHVCLSYDEVVASSAALAQNPTNNMQAYVWPESHVQERHENMHTCGTWRFTLLRVPLHCCCCCYTWEASLKMSDHCGVAVVVCPEAVAVAAAVGATGSMVALKREGPQGWRRPCAMQGPSTPAESH